MGPVDIKDCFHMYFQSFHKITQVTKQQGQLEKTLNLQLYR